MFSEIDKIAQPSGIKRMITVCPLIGTFTINLIKRTISVFL